jgi:gas vesicle protein
MMNRHKEELRMMKNVSGLITAAFTGFAAGILIGIFIAPQSGKETREEISEKSREIFEKGKETAEDMMKEGKDFLGKQKERVSQAFEEGKEKVKDLKEKAVK